MYRKVMMFFSLVGVSLSLVLGLFSIITWQIVAVLITVSLGIPSLVLTYEKLTSEVSVKPKEERREQEQEVKPKERDILREETIRVSPNDEFYYVFELKRGDNLKGEISSTDHIDIYFVDNTNFRKWEKDRTFECEYCNESVLKAKIDYEVPKRGIWYLLMENNGRKTAIVKVLLYLSN